MTTPPSTLYTRLSHSPPQIRLLSIHSSSLEISCRLHIVTLSPSLEFTALSYVWGPPEATETILVNNRPVSVRSNLANALRNVTYHWKKRFPNRPTEEFRLWADVICINQEDVPERNFQVKLMRELYASAELVISWLGNSGRVNMFSAMEALGAISRETKGIYLSADQGPKWEWMKGYPCLTDRGGVDGLLNAHWQAIQDFFEVDYFKRAWIFQELVLGREIVFMYGRDSIGWDVVADAARWLVLTGQAIRKKGWNGYPKDDHNFDPLVVAALASGAGSWWKVDAVAEMRVTMASDDKDGDVRWDLFPKYRYLAATNPRDHIYALLGVARGDNLVVDYDADIVSVYLDYVNAWVQDTGRVEVLCYSGIGMVKNVRETGAPSWMPNYPYENDREAALFRNLTDAFLGYNADKGVFDANSTISHIRGISLFVTAVVGPAIRKVHERSSTEMWDIASDFMRRNTTYITGIHPLKAFFQAVIGDETRTGRDLVAFVWEMIKLMQPPDQGLGYMIHSGKKFRALAGGCRGGENIIDCFERVLAADSDSKARSEIRAFVGMKTREQYNPFDSAAGDFAMAYTVYTRLCFSRHVCETKDGYIGIAPFGTLPGDRVAVVKGCNTPVVIRLLRGNTQFLKDCSWKHAALQL
ncbi:heterokaryon incompatibility protein-domain-containing protein [Podospora fimiseda]|uniref:Heterokaryon incompatibility protein-domain-containing protein n=1 Tax=Podospora fimiseda TaxID=252190 RepID=A0AAN6YNY5_9PEZI|nr:heterokaryon incompatibility protein-domain-containing protein [Podospora fimiseda]